MTAVVGQTLWTDPEQLRRQNRRQNCILEYQRTKDGSNHAQRPLEHCDLAWEASHHQRWTLEPSWHNQFERMLKAAMELERALKTAMGTS